MHILIRCITFVLCLPPTCLLAVDQAPGLRLPAIFSDHMVLQRDLPVPLWGWAQPGEDVTISLASQTLTAKASSDGRWKVVGKPMLFSLANSWAKFYQVDKLRSAEEANKEF